MSDLDKILARVNADLAKVSKVRLVGVDEYHVYLFKNGVDALTRSSAASARLLSYEELRALFYFYGKEETFRMAKG